LFLAFLRSCSVLKRPEKATVYTTLIGLLNAKLPVIGGEIVTAICKQLQTELNKGNLFRCRLLVRFLADLGNANMLDEGAVIKLLNTLVTAATAKDVACASRSDTLMLIVLGCIPWVGLDLSSREEDAFQELMDEINKFRASRPTDHLDMICTFSGSAAKGGDVLETLWAQVNGLQQRETQWAEVMIHRPYIDFHSQLGEVEDTHPIPAITIPDHVGVDFTAAHVPLQLFTAADTAEGPAMPPVTAIERFVSQLQVSEILEIHGDTIKECVRRLKMYTQDNKQFAVYHLVVETILGELFRLPGSLRPHIFYFRLLIELVRESSRFTEAVGLAMDLIFRRVGQMDVECVDRYVQWLVHFHNYFNFKFRWVGWDMILTEHATANECDESGAGAGAGGGAAKNDTGEGATGTTVVLSSQRALVREVLARSLRLSFHPQIVNSVPERFATYVPASPALSSVIDRVPEWARAASQCDALRVYARESDPDVAALEAIVAKITVPAEADEAEDGEFVESDGVDLKGIAKSQEELLSLTATKIFTAAVLDAVAVGLPKADQFSLNGFCSAIERHADGFKLLCATRAARLVVVQTAHSFWAEYPQMLSMGLGKLMQYKIVDPISVVDWVFSGDGKLVKGPSREIMWECFFDALSFAANELKGVRSRVDLERAARKDEGAAAERLEVRLQEVMAGVDETFILVFDRFAGLLASERMADPKAEGWLYANILSRFNQTARRFCLILWRNELLDKVEASTSPEDDATLEVLGHARMLAHMTIA
jgi:nuclear cap-binding protein subunit 1